MAEKEFGALPPHWLDPQIDGVWRDNNPHAIARAIFTSPQVIAAIERGIAKANEPKPPHWHGPSHAQFIRQEVVAAISSSV